MPTGLGNRKVLTPRRESAPRRSLPTHAKLIEAESFESLDLAAAASSPDIMTAKLQEKVKRDQKLRQSHKTEVSDSKHNASSNAALANAFNERLSAAAASVSSKTNNANSSNTAAMARSKLSTDEFPPVASNKPAAFTSNHKSFDYEPAGRSDSRSFGTNSNSSNNNTVNGNNFDRWTHNPASIHNSNHGSLSNNNFGHGYSSTTAAMIPPPSHHSFSESHASLAETALLQEQLTHWRREFETLKQRFSDLTRLRSTEPETALEEYKRRAEARDLAAERTIQSLQKENELLRQQLKENSVPNLSTNDKAVSNASTAKTSSNAADVEMMEKIVKIYSGFSGLRIEPDSSATTTRSLWNCTFTSRSVKFPFKLSYDAALHRYQLSCAPDTSINLPAFMAAGDILITPDQMQTFFWRLLDSLMKQKETERV